MGGAGPTRSPARTRPQGRASLGVRGLGRALVPRARPGPRSESAAGRVDRVRDQPGVAILDEAHQSLVPTRTASGTDVAIDGIGTLLALGVARLGWRGTADRATARLLWAGLLGGGAFLVVNALAGVPSGPLRLTAPATDIHLLARYLHARHRPRRPPRSATRP